MAKKRKRKTPDKDTVRELFLKSGNQCAFPGCQRLIMDSAGDYIAQLCHIEAAEEGGQRFNEASNDDEAAHFDNLMLMCYEHHVKTNNVDEYSVERLKQLKKEHEDKFTDITEKISDGITNKSSSATASECSSIAKLNELLKYDYHDEDLELALADAKWLYQRISSLPYRTRQLLSIILSKLTQKKIPARHGYRYYDSVSAFEVAETCYIEMTLLAEHVEVMWGYGIAAFWPREFDQPASISLRDTPNGYLEIADLRMFSELAGVPLDALVVELRFDLLDK